MKKKIVAFITIIAVLSTIFAGCGNSSDTSGSNTAAAPSTQDISSSVGSNVIGTVADTSKQYDKIKLAVNSDWGNMLPVDPNEGSRSIVMWSIYETLFMYTPTNSGFDMYQPFLAKDYEKVTVDGYTSGDVYDIHLFDYIHDTAGNTIDADDVLYCYNYYFQNGYTNKSDCVDHFEKVDTYTFRMYFNKTIDSVGELEVPWCHYPVVDQTVFEGCATNPIGTGVYKCKEFVSGSHIIFEANDNYWQTDKSYIGENFQSNVKEFEVDVVPEASSQVIMLQTGDIDYSEVVPYENLADFQENGQYSDKYNVVTRPQEYTYCIIPSHDSHSVCQNADMRRAIYYAISNEAIAAALGGNAIAAKSLGSPVRADYSKAWENDSTYINTCDPTKTAELLKSAGYNGEELVISYENAKLFPKIAEIMQNMLVSAGINCKLNPVETAQARAMKSDSAHWDIYLGGFGGSFLIGGWFKYLNYTDDGTGYCVGGYKDETLQKLFSTAYTMEGHTEENMTALLDYAISDDNAYIDALCIACSNVVYSKAFSSLYYVNGSWFYPGSCTYNFQ